MNNTYVSSLCEHCGLGNVCFCVSGNVANSILCTDVAKSFAVMKN